MESSEKKTFAILNQIMILMIEGKLNLAIELMGQVEKDLTDTISDSDFVKNFKDFVLEYSESAIFLNEISNGNLESLPPKDPKRRNYIINQLKQLHSNLLHLTWQTQQISKGDLNQKVSFLGEFSIGFNKMIESLREKKQMEDQIIQQFHELQKLNAEKDKFFSIIAHDLRNPFVSFLGFTELMAENVDTFSQTEMSEMANELKKSAQNLYVLLENLLEWSRIQRGLVGVNLETIELLPHINDILQSVFELANKKDIEIVLDIPKDLTVRTDMNMLSSTIRNLATNAIKFTPHSGKVSIAATIKNAGIVEISVRDTGIGMSQDFLTKLFKMDGKTSRLGTDGEPSTGLGLLLCKDFVEKQGGEIWVESMVGIGSTFFFTVSQK
jgi:signal transduction histidine kinase